VTGRKRRNRTEAIGWL